MCVFVPAFISPVMFLLNTPLLFSLPLSFSISLSPLLFFSPFGLSLLLYLLSSCFSVPLRSDPRFWALCLSDMRWLRNQVVAPLTEELVFRACMLPMLVPCAGPSTAILTCPLFFGVGECCCTRPGSFV